MLKNILKSNKKSGRGDPALLKRLKACLFLLCLHLAENFVTIQHNVFSNVVLSILRHARFTEASFEPITFLPIFLPFLLNWPLQGEVYFRSWYLERFNHDKKTCSFPLINQLFRRLLDLSQKWVWNHQFI